MLLFRPTPWIETDSSQQRQGVFMTVRSCLRHVLNILNRKKLARRKITFFFYYFILSSFKIFSFLRLFMTRDMMLLSLTMLFTGLVRSLCFGVYSTVIGYTKG